MSKLNNTKKRTVSVSGQSALSVAVMNCIEPVLAAIDANPNWIDDPAVDSGQDKPSTNDVGLRIAIGFVCQHFHTQLYGPIVTKKGQIDSATDRLSSSEKQMQDHCAKYAEDPMALSTDPRTYTLNHYFQVNEARVHMYRDLLHGFTTVYEQITNEVWQPQTNSNASSVRKVEVTNEAKANAEALMAKFLKKSPNNSAGSKTAA